jgi:hypothetical protein
MCGSFHRFNPYIMNETKRPAVGLKAPRPYLESFQASFQPLSCSIKYLLAIVSERFNRFVSSFATPISAALEARPCQSVPTDHACRG